MNKFPVYKLLQRTTLVLTVLLMVGPAQQPALAMPKLEDESPSLTLTKVADSDTISPGQTITFTITIINEGDDDAKNIRVEDDYNQDILPTIADIQSIIITKTQPSESGTEDDETDGDIFPAQNDGEKITWDIGIISPSDEIQLSYQATATEVFKGDNVIMVNTATIFVNENPLKQAVAELTLQIPELKISRDLVNLDGVGDILLGNQVRITIRITNSGTANAEDINIVETFDESIVHTVDNPGGGEQRDGATISWSVENLEAGASSGVSYEVTLNEFPIPGFEEEPGILEIHNEVTISAMGIEPVSDSFSHIIHTPIITIVGECVDLNGDNIEPGDTLRCTITINNEGEVAAKDITIQEDFDVSTKSEINDISDEGSENAEKINWTQATLEPGAEKSFTYELVLTREIDESIEVTNTAFAKINNIELDHDERALVIKLVPEDDEVPPQLFTQDWILAVLMGTLVIIFAIQIAFISNKLIEKEMWKDWYLRNLVDLTAAIFILVVVVLLSANNTLPVEGTIGIISGIAGYMLGRSGK